VRAVASAWAVALVLAGALPPLGAAPTPTPTHGSMAVLDAATGRTLWSRRAAGPELAWDQAAIGSRLLVAVQHDCENGQDPERVTGFDAETGTRRWAAEGAGVVTVANSLARGSPTTAVDADGIVVVRTTISGTRGVAARTGRVTWKQPGDASGVAGDLVFFTPGAAGHQVLEAHDRRSGALRWTTPAAPTEAWEGSVVVVAGDTQSVVVATGTGVDSPTGSVATFHVLDARSGRERSSFTAVDASFFFSGFVLADGALTYATPSAIVSRALDDGATRWTQPTIGRLVYTGGDEGILVNSYGTVHGLDPHTGELRWSVPNADVSSVDGSRVLIQPRGTRRLRGVRAATGTQIWERRAPSDVTLDDGAIDSNSSHGRVALRSWCGS
jgi:PQQ-like domain